MFQFRLETVNFMIISLVFKPEYPSNYEYFKNDFVFDIEQAITISRPFILDEKYELLQEDTRNVVLIFGKNR